MLHEIGDIRLENIETPDLKESEVLVKVMAAGICGSDIPRIYETGAHVHPLIPGHEFSGQVVEIGCNVDMQWKGKRVGVFPLIPCGQCKPCQAGHYEMCRNYNYLGSRCDGGFAEYVAVPESNLIELPANVSYEEGAMLEPMAVAVHAMRRIELQSSETVVVLGLGTIGLLLTMFLMEQRINRILVIGNKEFQKKQVKQLGIPEEHYCDCRNEDVNQWIMSHTNGNGADVVFECVGKNETYSQAVSEAAPSGKVVLMGNPHSDMNLNQHTYWKILRNQLQIAGTWNSSFCHDKTDDWHYVLERLMEKQVHPSMFISHEYALEDLKQGLHIMKDKTEDYIKIMCINH